MRSLNLHASFRSTIAIALACAAAIMCAACATGATTPSTDYAFDPAERYVEIDQRWILCVSVLKRACNAMIQRTEGLEYSAVWRIGSDQRYGESLSRPISHTQILTGKTGAATIGRNFFQAWQYTGDPRYYFEAHKIARLLAWLQTDYGGWEQVADLSGYDPDWTSPRRSHTPKMSLDDQCTSECIHLMLDLSEVCDDQWLADALDFGLNKLEEHQLSNGGWPQWIGDGVPDNSVSRNAYINDYVTTDIMNVMLRAGRTLSARKAGDFFLNAELEPYSGWAEQYTVDMVPWRARMWEQPEISSIGTSIAAISLLHLASETSNARYIEPVLRARRFLQPRVVNNGRWARYYRISNGNKVYVDRYGTYYDRFNDIPDTHFPPGVVRRAALRGVSPYNQMHHDDPAEAIRHIDAFQQHGLTNYPESLDPTFAMTLGEIGYEKRRLYARVSRILGDLSRNDEWVDSSNTVLIDAWQRRIGWIFELLDLMTREPFDILDYIPDTDSPIASIPDEASPPPPPPGGGSPQGGNNDSSIPSDPPPSDVAIQPYNTCDFDEDGDIDAQDKAKFRAAWRTKLSSADFNDDGKITRRDKKKFLRQHKEQRRRWKQDQQRNDVAQGE